MLTAVKLVAGDAGLGPRPLFPAGAQRRRRCAVLGRRATERRAPSGAYPLLRTTEQLALPFTAGASSPKMEASSRDPRGHAEFRARAEGESSWPAIVEPSTMARRQMVVKRLLAALLLLPFLASCSSHQTPRATPESASPQPGQGRSLSQDEVAKAVAVAREVIADQGASVSSASAVARSGRIKDSNTGHPCTSGRVLKIKLIGKFPHTLTTGHPVQVGDPAPDFTVRAMIITADAQSGRACLTGVQTAENGEVMPIPDAMILQVQ